MVKGKAVRLAQLHNDSMKYFCAWITYYTSLFIGVYEKRHITCDKKSKLINH